jgi:hypothetical protein
MTYDISKDNKRENLAHTVSKYMQQHQKKNYETFFFQILFSVKQGKNVYNIIYICIIANIISYLMRIILLYII